MVDYKHKIIIGSITLLDVGTLAIIYFVIGFYTSYLVNNIYNEFYVDDNRSKIIIFLEICSQIFFIGILIYLIQKIIRLIPFPLNGIYGYDHKLINELPGVALLGFGLFYGQDNIVKKLQYIVS